jgi:hypothetical protein
MMDSYELHARVGKFRLRERMVRDKPDDVMLIMGKMITTRCELVYNTQSFHYIAISPLFDKAIKGEMIPDYSITVTDDGQVIAERQP